MADYEIRALEIHSAYAWDFNWIMKCIKFAKNNNMNTLVLHRNDLVDLIVYPGKYFGCMEDQYSNIFERYKEIFRVLYKYTPTRRSGPYQRKAFLKRVLEEAKRANIDVYIENKELNFPEILLELNKDKGLMKDGTICPNEPFWMDFVTTKYKEFFEEFPDIAGIITAPATGESKVSISSNRCICDLCQSSSPQQWYNNLIRSMYNPIKDAGKKLIIRDFVFNAEEHKRIAEVMENLPNDIGIALKNTPHDYYPTFPDNPRIGNVGHHDQWIEFDAWGQYFGWGIGPSIMIEDFRNRMQYARGKGASGVIFRTDWESLDSHSGFDTLNYINLFAGALLADNLETKNVIVYKKWLEDKGYYHPGITKEQKRITAEWVDDILGQTWEVIRRTVFVDGCVFSDSSQLPVSLEHALWLAEEKNSLKEWDRTKSTVFSAHEKNVQFNLSEKDEALERVQLLSEKVRIGNEGITKKFSDEFSEQFKIFEEYVKIFRIVTYSIILTHYLISRDHKIETDFSKHAPLILKNKLKQLKMSAEDFEHLYRTTSFPYRVYTLLDSERLTVLYDDLCKRLQAKKIY